MSRMLPKFTALSIVQAWVDKGKSYCWERSPTQIQESMLSCGGRGKLQEPISYDSFSSILRSAETSKMRGDANAGFSWMRQEFRKIADVDVQKREDPQGSNPRSRDRSRRRR